MKMRMRMMMRPFLTYLSIGWLATCGHVFLAILATATVKGTVTTATTATAHSATKQGRAVGEKMALPPFMMKQAKQQQQQQQLQQQYHPLRQLQRDAGEEDGSVLLPREEEIRYDPVQVQTNLNVARSVWNSHAILDYELAFERSCYCFAEYVQPTVVVVVDGIPHTAYIQETGEALSEEVLQYAYTVESMFDLVQSALDRQVFSLFVEYDTLYGFVTLFFQDESNEMCDDEIGITFPYMLPIFDEGSSVISNSTANTTELDEN